ncbi:MAG TPA: hypothetical protein VMW34_01255, partial [Anaerolineales bacterium]|nr:hypothetical protein [Anaerolineales bacterium]
MAFLPSAGEGGIKNAPIPGIGDERKVRGTTPFRLTNKLIKKTRRCCDGMRKPASLHLGTTIIWFIPIALITVATPARVTRISPLSLQLQGPFSADVRAEFSPFYRSLAASSARTRP